MEIKELEKFGEEQIKKLEERYGLEKDKEKDNWAYALKLGEELGELYQELLFHKGYQRKEKMKNFDAKNIQKEIIDVLFTLIILGKSLNMNIEQAIIDRMKHINDRDIKEAL